MKLVLPALGVIALLSGCGQNEPGTMGGEPATPRTVATGAPKEAAQTSVVSNPEASAIRSEHAMSSFDDASRTNVHEPTLPQASTQTNTNAQR